MHPTQTGFAWECVELSRSNTHLLHCNINVYGVSIMAVIATNSVSAIKGDSRFSQLSAQYRAWRAYRRTLNELSALSDRELADIGLNRANLAFEAKHSS